MVYGITLYEFYRTYLERGEKWKIHIVNRLSEREDS